MEDPKRTPWQCTASVGSALLGDLIGLPRSNKIDDVWIYVNTIPSVDKQTDRQIVRQN